MAYHGTLLRVYDNTAKSGGKSYWRIVIYTDKKGESSFNLWNKRYAGMKTEEGEIQCDVHSMIGERVVFEATAGKVKDAATGERWPSTLDMIALESSETKPGGPPVDLWHDTAQEPTKQASGDLARLTMNMLNALGAWASEIERRTK